MHTPYPFFFKFISPSLHFSTQPPPELLSLPLTFPSKPDTLPSRMSSARLTRTLYKSLLRSARRMDELIPTPLFSKELSAFELPSNIPLNLSTKSFTASVSRNFRTALKFAPRDEETTRELQDIALKNLSIANSRIASLTGPVTTSASSIPSEVEEVQAVSPPLFSAGQVFQHRQHGYRAVICGYDPVCKASPAWVKATGADRLPHGIAQPFYHTLVHAHDRPGAQVSYCAQDNICLLSEPVSALAGSEEEEVMAAAGAGKSGKTAVAESDAEELTVLSSSEDEFEEEEQAAASSSSSSPLDMSFPQPLSSNPLTSLDRFILHPLLPSYFTGYNAKLGSFIPSDALQRAFPQGSSSSDSSEESDEGSHSTSAKRGHEE